MPRIISCGNGQASDPDLPRKYLIYGNSGVGKTHSLLTLPASMRPALFLDLDGNSSELRRKGSPDLGTIVNFDMTNKQGLPVMYEEVKKFVQTFHAGKVDGLDHACADYKTVVVDSFTVLVAAIKDAALRWYIQHGEKGNEREDDSLPPTQGEYGMIAHWALKFVRGILPLNRHLIFICHESTVHEDPATGQKLVGPALQRSIATDLPRYIDEILYAKVTGQGDSRQFVWLAQPSGRWMARSAFGLAEEVPQDFGVYELEEVPST